MLIVLPGRCVTIVAQGIEQYFRYVYCFTLQVCHYSSSGNRAILQVCLLFYLTGVSL